MSTDIRSNRPYITNAYLNYRVVNYDGVEPDNGSVLVYDEPTLSWSFDTVMTNGNQTIDGEKTFLGSVRIGLPTRFTRMNFGATPNITLNGLANDAQTVTFADAFASIPHLLHIAHVPSDDATVISVGHNTSVSQTSLSLQNLVGNHNVHTDHMEFTLQ